MVTSLAKTTLHRGRQTWHADIRTGAWQARRAVLTPPLFFFFLMCTWRTRIHIRISTTKYIQMLSQSSTLFYTTVRDTNSWSRALFSKILIRLSENGHTWKNKLLEQPYRTNCSVNAGALSATARNSHQFCLIAVYARLDVVTADTVNIVPHCARVTTKISFRQIQFC